MDLERLIILHVFQFGKKKSSASQVRESLGSQTQ